MPSLTWPGKHLPAFESARLIEDSIIFPDGKGYPSAAAEDRLILGDNARVMTSLLTDLEGQVNLIYIDPPFFSNRHYPARIGRGEDSRRPQDWALAEGYADDWPDLDSYLGFLYPRLALMHRLLAASGTLYVHLDWHANAYARVLLDEIFGAEHLLNEIVWTYHGPSPIRSAFNRKHDTILAYVKGTGYTFNADAVRQPYNPATIQTFKASPKAGFGKVPDLERGKVPEDWWYFPVVARLHKERTGYPTQTPEALLERIILASSNPGDLVADFFCGSGTAAVVSARLGRRYIAVDKSFRALHATRRRLCSAASVPFRLQREDSLDPPFTAAKGMDSTISPAGIRLTSAVPLDYWEVDPDWDGEVFRSAAQAQRSNDEAAIPLELRIKTGRRVCVRVVTASGDATQQVLDV
ncbi:MAG TPA: DNA methyltransferase [Anaerolineales bacterium]|nr:DNA methyltransferase [Anaerolineales bacterium]